VRYRFIREQHDWHSVKTLCRVMKVSRGGYYDWLKREPCARQREDQRLLKKIEKLHYAFKEAYGAIRLSGELEKIGERCSRHRVARLKRSISLWTKRRRRFVVTTKADPGHVRYPNILARQFEAPAADRVWVGDVTSVWTLEGWLYLAILLDLHSRRIVGWSMGGACGDELTLAALRMALERRQPTPGLLHHTDRGAHYTSERYQSELRNHGVICSMSRIANCLDNAAAESFFSTLKNELTLHERYRTRADARTAIFEFIEMFYNPVRQHSYLDGLSPAQFEAVTHGLTTCP
jgi:putative transposase